MTTNTTAVSGIAVQVYTPAASGTPAMSIFNNGSQTAYLGGSGVTVAGGLPLGPQQSLHLQGNGAGNNIWAVSSPGALGTATTLSADTAVSASTAPSVSTAGFTAGNVLQIGSGYNAETALIGTIPSGSVVVFSSGLRFAHGSGEALALVSAPLSTNVSVNAGTR